MKKTTAILLGSLIASSAALAQSNVLSRNAVGYIKQSAPANQLNMVSLTFESMDGAAYTVTNLIGSQLPVGSSVFIWNRANATYVTENRTRSGWTPGTNVINRGDGLFIRSAAGTNVFFMGEVPDSTTAPSTALGQVSGLSMYSYPYPVARNWTDIELSQNGAVGDSLIIWDVDTQTYASYNRTRSGWGSATNVVIEPGQAFWYQTATTQSWDVVKPYDWP